jgi:hypothetical protein
MTNDIILIPLVEMLMVPIGVMIYRSSFVTIMASLLRERENMEEITH